MIRPLTRALILTSALLSVPIEAEEWPQFRGPLSNSLVSEADVPETWGPGDHLHWSVDVPGRALSSPIIWGTRVFLTTCIEEKAPALAERRVRGGVYRWEVHCLALATGKTLWKRVATRGEPRMSIHQSNTYASETPVTDGERVYAYFGMTGLYAYDFSGELLWKKDLGVYPMERDWGTSSSPVLYKGRIHLQIDSQEDSFLIALDTKTGDTVWRVDRDEGSNWSTPVIWKNRERTELVTAGKRTRSYDPDTGRLLWELDIGGGRCSSSPTGTDALLFVGSESRQDGGGNLVAVKAGAQGDITPGKGQTTSSGVLWFQARTGMAMASPLAYQGVVYVARRRAGVIAAYDMQTGEEIYEKRLDGARSFWASPWARAGKVYFLDDGGTAHVLRAGREFEVLARNSLDGEYWASPALAHGALILRELDSVHCIRRP